jgi:D-3-phosphoglycerate dehydrogenase
MSRVVLLDGAGDLAAVAAALRAHPEVTVEAADRAPAGDDVVALLAGGELAIGAAELAAVPNVRIVAATATGFDHLDLAAIAAAGVWATHCPGYCDAEVADHAIACALALLRGVGDLDRAVRAGHWDLAGARPRRIAGSVLGIVGLGRIGREVAERGGALGMTVLASDPHVTPGASATVTLVALPELLAAADVVTLHVALTAETTGLIGAAQLALMRPESYLVNCARAALVDHAALGEALHAGRLGGCALDVLPVEPPPAGEPALGWPRTLLSPHAAYFSPETEHAPYRLSGEAVAAVLEGREPAGVLVRPG